MKLGSLCWFFFFPKAWDGVRSGISTAVQFKFKGKEGKGLRGTAEQGSQSEQDGVEGLARWVVRAPDENTRERGAFKFLPLLSS